MSWKTLMSFAHDNAYFVCSLCEKNTKRNEVNTRRHPDCKVDALRQGYRWQWQCDHCDAWHDSVDDFYKPKLIQSEGQQ